MARTITDEEIALIKAMLVRGMKNADIQFFFNRPGRHVNSGRITNIADNGYSNSCSIPAASDEALNAFFDSRSPSDDVPPVTIGPAGGAADPVSATVLRAMFAKDAAGHWRLHAGETDTAECKASFSLRHAAPWLRAVAALTNNRGGYVFFGVADRDEGGVCRVAGLSGMDFRDADPGKITERLQSAFQPTPRTQKAILEIDGKTIGVLHVERHDARPIIATKNDGSSGEIKEGDIFHRYPGASRRISYGDLRAMLDERDLRTREAILPMVQRLLELGPDRAMIADLAAGKLTDGKTSIELSEEIVERLAVIKEGEFEDGAGAPALRLIGDVKAAAAVTVKRGIITRDDMRRAFLADSLDADAIDYLRVAVEVSGSDWLPIRYFASKAGLGRQQTLAFIDGSPGPPKQRALCRQRLSSPDEAYSEAKGPPLSVRTRLLAGEDVATSDRTATRLAAQAVQGLVRPLTVDATPLRSLLSRCLDVAMAGDDQFARSVVRRAIARLDELTSQW
jgi:CBS domain-containing protein